MPAGGVGPGLLDQRLIVPEAHAIHARQVRGHLAEARVQNQPPHIHIVLPQVNALHKYIVVVSFFAILIHLLMQHAFLAAAPSTAWRHDSNSSGVRKSWMTANPFSRYESIWAWVKSVFMLSSMAAGEDRRTD